MQNIYDQTEIENGIVALLRAAGVSEHIYTNRPRSTTPDLADFVVCRISGGIVNRCAYGECTFAISLFAQDVSNIKNSKKLSVLQSRLMNALPYTEGRVLFKPFSVRIIGDTPDAAGYHARVINIQAFIKYTK